MDKFNNQFATQKLRQEMSVTGTGASFTPGTGEQMATNKAFKKKTKKEVKDVEPKLAAGKAKVYPKEKWGWKDAPSIPNRPSKGGFIYKQLFEELSDFVNEVKGGLEIDDVVKVVYGNQFYGKIGKIMDVRGGFVIVGFMYDEDGEYLDWDESLEDDREIDVEEYSMHSSDVEKIDGEDGPVSDYGRYRQDPESYEKDYQEKGTSDYFQRRGLDEIENEDKVKIVDSGNKYFGRTGKVHDIHDDNTAMIIVDAPGNPTTTVDIAKLKPISGINENYSKFKTETKTRGKSDQFHQAVREVRKKVQEINRLFEYVSRLKSELSEGEGGLKYKVHTEKALQKIKEMVSALNQNVKKFK